MKKLKNTTSHTGFLDNRDNLFSMLVALARRNEGELRFTLEDIDEVKKYKNLHFTESYILQTFRHVFDKHNDKLDNIINSKN